MAKERITPLTAQIEKCKALNEKTKKTAKKAKKGKKDKDAEK